MKKTALVFVVAVFVPSLALAWLAFRSLADQQLVLERQQSLLFQGVADGVVREINSYFVDKQREFGEQLDSLIADKRIRDAAYSFDQKLRETWPLAEIGFVVSLEGEVFSPSMFSGSPARKFRLENDKFLCSKETVEVFWNSPKGSISLSKLDNKEEGKSDYSEKAVYATKAGKVKSSETTNAPPATAASGEEAEFKQLIGDSSEGIIARFLQNKLNVLLWRRPASDPKMIFGAQMKLDRVVADLKNLVRTEPALARDFCLVLLDDQNRPAVSTQPDFRGDWKRPFVLSEIGDILPHWQVAGYLLNPGRLSSSAKTLRLTLGLLIGVLLLAIGVGSWLIVADLKRQLTLARQKTDFVSNVSHEFKTPLTAIRMFSELLAEGRVEDPAKQRSYLNIISTETARLTRMINNVLDFARLERGEKKYQFQKCDWVKLVRETVESYRPHLEAHGYRLELAGPEGPVWVQADPDALSQVLVNLISNAEKYGGEKKEILIEMKLPDANSVEVGVINPRPGVPNGCEKKIFEQFFRAHDSLDSGIQGSGLGLTLARQIAEAHSGLVDYQQRPGGGSTFTIRLPIYPRV